MAGSVAGSRATQRVSDLAAQSNHGDFCAVCAPPGHPRPGARERLNEAVDNAAVSASNAVTCTASALSGHLNQLKDKVSTTAEHTLSRTGFACGQPDDTVRESSPAGNVRYNAQPATDDFANQTTAEPSKLGSDPTQAPAFREQLSDAVASARGRINDVAVQTHLAERVNLVTVTAKQSLDSAAMSLNQSKPAQWLRYWSARDTTTTTAPAGRQHEEESSAESEQAAAEEEPGTQAVEDIQSWVESVEHVDESSSARHMETGEPLEGSVAESVEDTGEAEVESARPELSEEWMEHLEDLMEMGFDEAVARVELARCDGNVRLAVKALVAAEREAKA